VCDVLTAAVRLVIFDLDGTLVRPASGKEFPESALDWEVLPGRVARLRWLQRLGVPYGLASNQGGVAFGHMEPAAAAERVHRVARVLEVAHVQMCFHHPAGTVDRWRMSCFFRKPSTGMLLANLHAAGCAPDEALMVGDREEDRLAAASMGLAFASADVFFAAEAGAHGP
jgi:D-glycero-D-manno-heptose 1,7-bisphosphate phosphatase